MKVAKVNPRRNSVEIIELNGGEDNCGTLKDWYREVECDLVTHFYLYHLNMSQDLMFIMDDEAAFKKPEDQAFWQLPECTPIIGNALVFAIDPNTGDMVEFTDSAEMLKKKIRFLTHKCS